MRGTLARLVTIAAAANASAGCVNYIDTVHVRVRDPAQVAVSIETRDGMQPLIAAGSADTEAPLPPTEPPYHEAAQPGASIARAGDAALFAICAWCTSERGKPVVGADGAIALTGTPDAVLGRDGADLRMRYDYETALPCHRGHGDCERAAFSVMLQTPRANVLELHFERRVSTQYGELAGAKIGIGAGVIAGLMGAGLTADAIADQHGSGRWEVMGGGLLALTVSTIFLVAGISTLRAQDSNTPIAP